MNKRCRIFAAVLLFFVVFVRAERNQKDSSPLGGANLELIWNTFLGSSGADFGFGLTVDGSGNAYIAGRSDSTWGNPVNPQAGDFDVFVAKLDAGGALQWHTFLGSTSYEYRGDIAP